MTAKGPKIDLDPIRHIYRIGRVVARGGGGVVHFAQRRSDGRAVALKAVVFTSPTTERRWLREVGALVTLQHPRIAELVDFGTIVPGKSAYIATRFISGLTLENWIESRIIHDGGAACSIVLGTLEALEVLHDIGMAHRDVKAANVLLDDEVTRAGDMFDPGESVVLVDFGISRSFSADRTAWSRLTRTGVVVGTVDYLSPERIQGEPGDARADIWSAGILLHRILFGYTPFHSGVVSQSLVRAVTEPLVPPWRHREHASPAEAALFEVVAKALAKDPRDRYRDAREMRNAMLEAMRVGGIGSVMGKRWSSKRDEPTGPIRIGRKANQRPR